MAIFLLIYAYLTIAIFVGIYLCTGKNSSFKEKAKMKKSDDIITLSLLWIVVALAIIPGWLFYKFMKKIGVCE